jgi:hypothetical protein
MVLLHVIIKIHINLEEIWNKTRNDLEKNWKNLFILD